MPCDHKFQNDLFLENLDFKPTTVIVGTYNPEWPENNQAEWFYGRTQNNNFWDILPRLYNNPTLIYETTNTWKQFCRENLIAITDLIWSIQDADEHNAQHRAVLGNYADNNLVQHFNEHIFVNIVDVLEQNPNINNVYLTRGADGFWAELWNPVRNYCQAHGIHCQTLLTPSGYAYFQQGRYNRANPGNQLNLPDYILMRWSQLWHQI